MEELFYDLHIHSCLSPCGDDEMTPNNIVNMACLAGLELIAVTDHNSTKNCAAVMELGRREGLLVVPGMELTTVEDVHVLCLFPELSGAEDFCELVYSKLPPVKNRPDAFGRQYIMDSGDRVVCEEERLLSGSSGIGVYDVQELVRQRGGIAIPAHIDRASFSLIANMGIIDPAMDFRVFETTPSVSRRMLAQRHGLEGCGFISNSDAHDLTAILDGTRKLAVRERSAAAVTEALRALAGSG